MWRELVVRARRDGPAWVVAAVGVAMPGLRRIAGMLAAGWRGDTDGSIYVSGASRMTVTKITKLR